jgi:putative Holliday junction resolvase
MRILGLDHGRKRIGLAISDELGVAAHALRTLTVSDPEEAIEDIRQVVREKEVERIIVGLPLNMDGSEGPQAHEARHFARLLGERLALAVELQDERLSTVRAERALLEGDLTRAKREQRRDKMAAQFVLQVYLDRRRRESQR